MRDSQMFHCRCLGLLSINASETHPLTGRAACINQGCSLHFLRSVHTVICALHECLFLRLSFHILGQSLRLQAEPETVRRDPPRGTSPIFLAVRYFIFGGGLAHTSNIC